MTRRARYQLQDVGSREENRQSIQVSMQLRKLSRHDFLQVPLIVIPNLFRDPGLILSEDGGPLTDNVAFSSDHRVFVLKRSAALMDPVSPHFRLQRSALFCFFLHELLR